MVRKIDTFVSIFCQRKPIRSLFVIVLQGFPTWFGRIVEPTIVLAPGEGVLMTCSNHIILQNH